MKDNVNWILYDIELSMRYLKSMHIIEAYELLIRVVVELKEIRKGLQ